ncbi:hypothetical protein EVA_15760 [gut metagenome]|uniref:Uncharacterized protein n=1 Tax=gut metagenome TaxID=749906 RepID=J9FNV1_9ZZZZ
MIWKSILPTRCGTIIFRQIRWAWTQWRKGRPEDRVLSIE